MRRFWQSGCSSYDRDYSGSAGHEKGLCVWGGGGVLALITTKKLFPMRPERKKSYGGTTEPRKTDFYCIEALGTAIFKLCFCFFFPEVHAARPHKGQIKVAHRMRGLLHSDTYNSEVGGTTFIFHCIALRNTSTGRTSLVS